MTKAAAIAGIAITLLVFSLNTTAHSLSKEECAEGSKFIKNAALSRENGMDGATYIAKLLADFAVIKSFPIHLRWFVQDQQDEDFLLKAATEVFEHPEDAPFAAAGRCLVSQTLSEGKDRQPIEMRQPDVAERRRDPPRHVELRAGEIGRAHV